MTQQIDNRRTAIIEVLPEFISLCYSETLRKSIEATPVRHKALIHDFRVIYLQYERVNRSKVS